MNLNDEANLICQKHLEFCADDQLREVVRTLMLHGQTNFAYQLYLKHKRRLNLSLTDLIKDCPLAVYQQMLGLKLLPEDKAEFLRSMSESKKDETKILGLIKQGKLIQAEKLFERGDFSDNKKLTALINVIKDNFVKK